MNNLDGCISYLIGPIENAKDDGVNWRLKLKQLMFSANINIKWIDPCNKPSGGIKEIGKEKEKVGDLRRNGEYDKLTALMKTIASSDLRYCDLSDFGVFYYDPDVGTCGSFCESFRFTDQGKPLFMVCEKGKNRIPAWMFASVDHREMFESLESLVAHLSYLQRLPSEELMKDCRWVLIRSDLI